MLHISAHALAPVRTGSRKARNQARKPVNDPVKKPAGAVPQLRSGEKPVPYRFPAPPAGTVIDEKSGLAVGIKAGASAGLTGAMGDVSYSLNNVLPGASIRGSVGYLTGSKTTVDQIKMATVNLDALYNIGDLPQLPMNVYIGGGVIYPVKVNNNRGAGAWGAHAYLGSKYSLRDNTSIYGELAYTGIKYQADQPALRGVEAMLGYSYSF